MSYAPPPLHASPSRRHASRWIWRLTTEIGPGFHPDTDPGGYIDPGGERLIQAEQAELLARNLERARQTLGSVRFESIVLHGLWRTMGLRFDPASELLVPLG